MQYRVNIFGFMYLNSTDAPGNQGLLDQTLAMQWIQNNIQAFGGDNSKITIVGESAGAASVGLHLLSPLSANYYRNAVLESGSGSAYWVIKDTNHTLKYYSDIMTFTGCTSSTLADKFACFKNLDSNTILTKTYQYLGNYSQGDLFYFTPVVDNYFLSDKPINLLKQGKFKRCSILVGANKDEGNMFFYGVLPGYTNLNSMPSINSATFKKYLNEIFAYFPNYPQLSSRTVQKACLLYTSRRG